jgi:hypothetical protein
MAQYALKNNKLLFVVNKLLFVVLRVFWGLVGPKKTREVKGIITE